MLNNQEEQSKEEKAVLLEIVELIKELQNLPFLESFNLGGGTALALQFNHRTSEDIDLMSTIKFSSHEMMKIKESLISHFNERIIKIQIFNTESKERNEDKIFIRVFIKYSKTNDDFIKVEILQSVFQDNKLPKDFNGVKVIPIETLSSLKMGALLNRYADKDLHDIVYLSEELGFNKIVELYDNYRDAINKNHEYFGCFVDQESELIKDDPTQLLWFDKRFKTTRLDSVKILPTHKNNQLNLLKHSKTKDECLFKYKSYCRGYYSSINKPYPITAEVRKKRNKGLY